MKLPADMTEDEMRMVLKDIWREYAPEQSYNFIDQLLLENLKLLFDFIWTKDPVEQEKKRKVLEDQTHYSLLSINMILQKAKLTQIQVHEKNEQSKDEQSINDIENQF